MIKLNLPPVTFAWSKMSICLIFRESVTDQPTDGRTDQPTDKPGYRDARRHLEKGHNHFELIQSRFCPQISTYKKLYLKIE